ncbi:ubiquinol oxidase subunit 1 domain protein [Providencia stuartii]|nr:ubiquinol oxidase subunit 1 domain protein [Providencia stuartii]
MFGKLTLDAIPLHEPIVVVTLICIIIGGIALLGAITYFGKWKWLWKEWLTSVDHKKLVSCTSLSQWSCYSVVSRMLS